MVVVDVVVAVAVVCCYILPRSSIGCCRLKGGRVNKKTNFFNLEKKRKLYIGKK